MTLTDRERDALRCMVDAWMDADMPLPGSLSYQDAVDVLHKVGLYDKSRDALQRLVDAERCVPSSSTNAGGPR